jgi:hypothetical protein
MSHCCTTAIFELTGLGVFFAGLRRRKNLGTQKCACSLSSCPLLQFGIGRLTFDEVALTLNSDTTAKLAIVGKRSADETPIQQQNAISTLRSISWKRKVSIPHALRTRGELNRSLDDILVPAGASFIPGDTNTSDSNSVKRQRQPYAKPQNRH